MADGAGNVIRRDVIFPLLTENEWIRVLPPNGSRAYLNVQNEDLTNAVRTQFTKNPFALSFDGGTDLVDIDTLIAAAFTANVHGSVRARILRDAGGVGDDTIWSASDASANEYVKLFVDASNILKAELRTAAAVQWSLETDSAIPITTEFVEVKLLHTGTQPQLFINRNEVAVTRSVTTDETVWINGLSNLDVANLGCIDTNGAGNADFFLGDIDFVKIHGADSINTNRVEIADWDIDEGGLVSASLTIADGTANAFLGTLGVAGAAPTWIVRSTGTTMAALTAFEHLAAEVSPQAYWVFADEATPTTITLEEGVKG